MKTTLMALFALTVLSACSQSTPTETKYKERQLDQLDTIKAKLAFTCAYEKDRLPALNPDADILFKYARYLEKNNLLKQDAAVYPQVERLYRIATAAGHYKASINLQNGSMRNHFKTWTEEMADWAEALIKTGVPAGYFMMGTYLKYGTGVKKDADLSLRYFRKAADLGDPEAQYYVGDLLAPIDRAPEVARQMLRCAAEQGHGKAATELAIELKILGHYQEAVSLFQLGVMAGNESSASFLTQGFNNPPKTNELYYLGLKADPERSKRYEAIGNMLAGYSYANPKVPDLEKIVPLPPAKLPPWDGTLQWQKEFEANMTPEKPSEELINKLAKTYGLDTFTGQKHER